MPRKHAARHSKVKISNRSMPSQRIILGIGLAILLVISAASIGLDLKSRSDTASVDRARRDAKQDLGHAPAAAPGGKRGARLRADRRSGIRQGIPRRQRRDPAGARRAASRVHGQSRPKRSCMERHNALVERQIALNGELIRLQIAGDDAAVAALSARRTAQRRPRSPETSKRRARKSAAARRQTRRIRDAPAASCWRSISPASLLILILATVLTLSSPPLAPRTAGFAERHPGHQRGAGGRGRRAHRASGRRP